MELNKIQKTFLTVQELIRYTGYSQQQIYKLTQNKIIPHYKPSGRKILFKIDEIDSWIEKGLVKAKALLKPKG